MKYKIVNGSLLYQDLPIIEQKYDDDRPFVFILPVRGSYSDSMLAGDWEAPGQQYYIIENRRALGFDRYINRFTDSCGNTPNEQYGEIFGEGGFVVWEFVAEYTTNASRVPRIVEADGRYDLSTLPFGLYHKGEPTDLFSDQIFAPWTFPGSVTTVGQNGYPITEYRMRPTEKGRSVIAKYPVYTASSGENNIDLLASLDQYSAIDSATSGNNQRKLVARRDSIVMVYESGGFIFASKSTNAGADWHYCELNTLIAYANDSTEKPIVGTIPYHESAPSVCWIGDAAWMTWQRKISSGKWSILQRRIFQPTPFITYADPVADSVTAPGLNNAPTPVIGYGYSKMLNGQLTPIAKIVYATDSGLFQSITTDMGLSWSAPPEKISGTTGNSVRPSLAMNEKHSVLVYEQQNSQPGGGADLYVSVDDSDIANLTSTYYKSGLSDNRYPSVALNNDIIHVVWVVDYQAHRDSAVQQRTAHMQWNVTAMPSSIPKTFFDRKYGRVEQSEVPVIASQPSGTKVKGAALFWSVRDIVSGARLRSNRYLQNPMTGAYEWQYDGDEANGESGLTELTTRHPAITETDNGSYFVVTRGNAAPYHLASSYTPVPSQTSGSRTVDIATATDFNSPVLMRILSEQPRLRNGQQTLAALANAGIPDSGFDGSSQGPGITDLLKSQSILMDMSDVISWDVRILFDSTLSQSDTVFVVGRMIDSATGNIITSSNIVARRIANRDSAFTLSFELPPTHYPQANVAVTLELSNGPDEASDRFLSVMHHLYSDDVVPKRSVAGSIRRNASTESLRVHPNPARSDLLQASFMHESESAVSAEIFDVLGRSITTLEYGTVHAGYQCLPIDVSGLHAGQYFLRIHAAATTLTQRFTVAR